MAAAMKRERGQRRLMVEAPGWKATMVASCQPRSAAPYRPPPCLGGPARVIRRSNSPGASQSGDRQTLVDAVPEIVPAEHRLHGC